MVKHMIKDVIGIDESSYSIEALNTIRNWYKSNVSCDEVNNDDNEQAFADYVGWTKFYLETFEPIARMSLTKVEPTLENKSPLMFAACYGWDKWLEQHLTAEMFDNTTEGQYTLLQMAVATANIRTTNSLLGMSFDILDIRHQAKPLSHLALFSARNADNESDRKKSLNLFLSLCEKAPSLLQITDDSGNTVFHLMAEYDYQNLLENVLAEDAIEASMQRNNHGQYPHFVALLNGNDKALAYFLKNKSTHQLVDNKQRNIFHYLARGCSAESFLAIKNAFSQSEIDSLINKTDYEGKTAKDFLLENEFASEEIRKFFNDNNAQESDLTDSNGSIPSIKF